MQHVVVVIPIDTQVDEAQHVAQEDGDWHQRLDASPWDFLPFVNPNLSNFYPICTTGSRCIRLAS